MLPMLREDRDLVTIVPAPERLRRGDVALFRMDGIYVLHGVIGAGDGFYVTRGDNNHTCETVPAGDVIGVLAGFKRNGKDYGAKDPRYRLYTFLRTGLFPLRLFVFRRKSRLARLARRAGLLPLYQKTKNAFRKKKMGEKP